jgi:hypothetical protein
MPESLFKVKRLSELAQSGQLKGKRVLIRADLNVPQDEAGNITEDTRIKASMPAVQMCLDAGAAVMVTSHLGRPTEGEFKPEDSLAPVADRIASLLNRKVPLISDWVNGGFEVNPGELVLLENCRLNVGEKKNSDELAKKIAKSILSDVNQQLSYYNSLGQKMSDKKFIENVEAAINQKPTIFAQEDYEKDYPKQVALLQDAASAIDVKNRIQRMAADAGVK